MVHTLRRTDSSRGIAVILLTSILVVSSLVVLQVRSNAALTGNAKRYLRQGLASAAAGDEIADAINANTEARSGTTLAAEHGAGAIGTYAAPATTRRTINGTIITEIKVDLTGLDSSGNGDHVIGLASPGTGAAYVGKNVVATNGVLYRVEVICVELPATGDADILFVVGSAADETFDDTVADTSTLADGTGDWAAGQIVTINGAVSANYYYYMTQGASDNAAYSAGQFIIRTYGHAVF